MREQFRGFGGVLSFVPRGREQAADLFLGALRLIRVAPSLGGVESLASLPRLTSHRMLSSDERRALGLEDSVIRLALGIENVEDLLSDVSDALDSLYVSLVSGCS